MGFPDNHVLSESAELTIKNTVNLDEVIDQMIDVIASSVKAQSNQVNNFGGINQVQFLIDTLEILQFILKQGNGDMQMEKLFASNELEFLIQNVILRYKSKKVRERAAALILQMSEKESFFPRIFDLLHTALSQVNGDVGTCPQFFTMFEELTEKLNSDMLAKVVHYLVSSLKSYPNDEKPYLSQYSGNINTGFKHSFSISCLKLFAKLIEKQPTAYKFVIENEPEIVEKDLNNLDKCLLVGDVRKLKQQLIDKNIQDPYNGDLDFYNKDLDYIIFIKRVFFCNKDQIFL